MLTIGKFSKLCHISSRMLRHYDVICLLQPVHTDELTGYRYYDKDQFELVFLIEELKSYGFKLKEIKELVIMPKEQLSIRIHAKMIEQYNNLNALEKIVHKMENFINNMRGENNMAKKYEVKIINDPAQKVFGIKKSIHIGEIPDLFEEVILEMDKKGIKRNGPGQILYFGDEFSYENMEVEAQFQVTGNHTEIKNIKEQFGIKTIHTGPYDELRGAYDAICSWMAEN